MAGHAVCAREGAPGLGVILLATFLGLSGAALPSSVCLAAADREVVVFGRLQVEVDGERQIAFAESTSVKKTLHAEIRLYSFEKKWGFFHNYGNTDAVISVTRADGYFAAKLRPGRYLVTQIYGPEVTPQDPYGSDLFVEPIYTNDTCDISKAMHRDIRFLTFEARLERPTYIGTIFVGVAGTTTECYGAGQPKTILKQHLQTLAVRDEEAAARAAFPSLCPGLPEPRTELASVSASDPLHKIPSPGR